MFSDDNPLWMPKGSVRSILALVLLAGATAFAGWEIAINGKTPEWFPPLATAVVTAYFLKRNEDKTEG